jgi:hypothetical protein
MHGFGTAHPVMQSVNAEKPHAPILEIASAAAQHMADLRIIDLHLLNIAGVGS